VNFSGFSHQKIQPSLKCLSGFWIVENNSNLVTQKLIPTMRKRTTTYIIGVWFNTSTTIRDKLKFPSASNKRKAKTNNKEIIYILTVGLLRVDEGGRRRRPADTGVERGRRRASSRDGTSQKLIRPLPCVGTQGDVGFGDLLSRRRCHVGDGMGRRWHHNTVVKGGDKFCVPRTTSRPNIYTHVAAKVSN
jgi:hypothetical protein